MACATAMPWRYRRKASRRWITQRSTPGPLLPPLRRISPPWKQARCLTWQAVTQALNDTLTDTPRDLTLIEGAGGWRVPLNEEEDFSDLPRALGLPVILVVGLKLGCLNHARLTAEAIAADGLTLAGWVGSVVDSAFADDSPRFAANVALLKRALPAPCLGIIPHLATADAPTAQYYLSLDALLPLATQEATP